MLLCCSIFSLPHPFFALDAVRLSLLVELLTQNIEKTTGSRFSVIYRCVETGDVVPYGMQTTRQICYVLYGTATATDRR